MRPSPDVVDLLPAHGAPLDIFAGAVLGWTTHVTALLADDPALVNSRDAGGYTPLHLAVWNGKRDTALLLAAGADIDARNERGETPLCGRLLSTVANSTSRAVRRSSPKSAPPNSSSAHARSSIAVTIALVLPVSLCPPSPAHPTTPVRPLRFVGKGIFYKVRVSVRERGVGGEGRGGACSLTSRRSMR